MPYDLVAGKRLAVEKDGDGGEFWVEMERLGGTLVAFYPEPVEKVAIEVPKAARPLQDVKIRVRVDGKSGPVPGVVPIEIRFADPKGVVHVISGNFATRDGVYTLHWTPAVNDPLGSWTVRAKELASGRTAQATLVTSGRGQVFNSQ